MGLHQWRSPTSTMSKKRRGGGSLLSLYTIGPHKRKEETKFDRLGKRSERPGQLAAAPRPSRRKVIRVGRCHTGSVESFANNKVVNFEH